MKKIYLLLLLTALTLGYRAVAQSQGFRYQGAARTTNGSAIANKAINIRLTTAASLTAGKATVLAMARTINGVSFDGSANIAITANNYSVGGTLTNGSTIPGTSVVYFAADGASLTLPVASTAGQTIIILNSSPAGAAGITVTRASTNTITDDVYANTAALNSFTRNSIRLISNGTGVWFTF